MQYSFLLFESGGYQESTEQPTPENHGNPMIPDDMIRYLNEVAERTRLEQELNPDNTVSRMRKMIFQLLTRIIHRETSISAIIQIPISPS